MLSGVIEYVVEQVGGAALAELIATGATPPTGSPKLAAWRVTGLSAPIDPAIDFLLSRPAHSNGADLGAWHTAALLAMEIVAGQQVLQGARRDDADRRLAVGTGRGRRAVPPGVEFGGVQASGWLEEMFERLQNANQHY
jgi:hypothetical protein